MHTVTVMSDCPVKYPISQSHMGMSENSVALNPMVLLIIIPIKWLFIGNTPYFQTNPYHQISIWLCLAGPFL